MSHEPTPIETLLKLAGERDQPSSEATQRAREAARQSWQRGRESAPVRAASSRRTVFAWAAAAGVAALTAAIWMWIPGNPRVEVARVTTVQGDVRVPESPARIAAGAVLHAGQVLTTGEGRIALGVGDALSLRLDQATSLRLDGAGRMTLLQGALYVDSGGLNSHTDLRIETPAGTVRHVGTQFQVSVSADRTRVQVREGRVVIARSTGALDLAAGDLAEITGTRVTVDHDQQVFGAAWEWAAQTAPVFDIENRPLSEFLAWLAREHGWQLRYIDDVAQSRARDIRLHGSISGLDAAGMLERTALITGMPLSASDGMLVAGARP